MRDAVSQTRTPALMPESRIPHATILAIVFLMATLVFLCAAIVEDSKADNFSPLVALTFGINLIIGLICLVREAIRRPFSILQVHWVFYLTFFCIAPWAQYLNGYVPWNYALTDSDYVTTNALVTCWGVVFAAASMFGARNRRLSFKDFHDRFFDGLPSVSRRAEGVLLFLSFATTILVVVYVGFDNLWSRSTYSTELDKTSSLLFDKGLRAIPVFAFTFILIRNKQRRDISFALVLAGILLLVDAFPAGMARYNAAAIYGGLAILTIRPFMERRGLFPLLFLIVLLIVFPASNVFRTNEFAVALFGEQLIDTIVHLSSGFCSGDYDAYSILSRTVHYVDLNGVAMGIPLLTCILFFVPRSIWAAKSLGSGAIIVTSQGQTFTNIACPLPAEGMVNFGIVGLFVFAILAGLVCRRLDSLFYEGSGGGRVFYSFACMLFFFIMRGDLLSSWAYTSGYAFVFAVLLLLCNRLRNASRKSVL